MSPDTASVKLLAVILVILHIALSAVIAELSTERIVVHCLDDFSIGNSIIILRHLTDIAEVVLIVVAESEIILVTSLPCQTVSLLELVLVNPSVLHDKAATEKIVGGVFLLNRKCFRFTMCYFVCSDIVHFGDKGKQKNQ